VYSIKTHEIHGHTAYPQPKTKYREQCMKTKNITSSSSAVDSTTTTTIASSEEDASKMSIILWNIKIRILRETGTKHTCAKILS
jgi:hypothetical protein